MVAPLIRVFVVDAHPIVLEGLRCVLSNHSDIQVVGESCAGAEAVEKAVELQPDISVLDLDVPRAQGLTLVRILQCRVTPSTMIPFTIGSHRTEFVEAMKLGCSGI